MNQSEPLEFKFRNRFENLEDLSRLYRVMEIIDGPALGNTERRMLRELAKPGAPLDLIVQGLLAFKEAARYHVGSFDLRSEEGHKKACSLQAEIEVIQYVLDIFERMLALKPEPEPENPQ